MTFKNVPIEEITKNKEVIKNYNLVFNQIKCTSAAEQEYWSTILTNHGSDAITAEYITKGLVVRDIIDFDVNMLTSEWFKNEEYNVKDYIPQLAVLRKLNILDYNYREISGLVNCFAQLVVELHNRRVYLPQTTYCGMNDYLIKFHAFLLSMFISTNDDVLKELIKKLSIPICECM